MALKEVVTWRVTANGEVVVQAEDGDKALAEAKKVFEKMDEHVSWTLTQTKTWVKETEV